MAESRFVYVTYIRTTPENLWKALIDPEFTRRFWVETWQESEWKPGASWRIVIPDGRVADTGEVVEIDQPRKLVLRWRNELKDFHARRVGEIMAAAGYGADDVVRVGALVRKERLKSDAEAQMLEDVACIVFLEHYLGDFMRKTDQDKLPDVLAKTWTKMSALGHEQARKLDLPPGVSSLLEQGLARLRGRGARGA